MSHRALEIERDIANIKKAVAEMGQMVAESLRGSVKALTERNNDLAYRVIFRDRLIDLKELELESLCVEFVATRQPAASDVRFIYATSKINNELERIGDYTESIARHALQLNETEAFKEYVDLPKMAAEAEGMLLDALQAFAAGDDHLAQQTLHRDEIVDHLQDDIYREMLALSGKKPIAGDLQRILSILIITNKIERIADQVCNICEEVIYLATGQQIKHEAKRKPNVLFLCIGNSVRSQMAEAYLRAFAEGEFEAVSAGTHPTPLHPLTLKVMQEEGIDISHQRSKSLNSIDLMDVQIVITLCDEAAQECPSLPFKTNLFHWSIPDPVSAVGSEKEKLQAFRATRDLVKEKIREFIQAYENTAIS
ncbi:MAG: phosphate signaling complex protein PhoU [Deltaproteobacteria bacterium]|nr:phosphate signaling complex protein PhoU [Deltaproteobacteria bacterium]